MRCGVVVIVLATIFGLPIFGQHGGGSRGGSIGHAAGHLGFAGHAGLSGSRSFAGSVGRQRYGGFSRPAMPMRSGSGALDHRLGQYRPAYRPGYGNRHGYDRNHWRRGWYGGAYPGWGYVYPYPYVIDPGFYDWSYPADYGDDSTTSVYAPYSDYGMPYMENPEQPYSGLQPPQSPYPYAQAPYPNMQAPFPYPQAPASSGARHTYEAPISGVEKALTLIFKNGRTPQTMRNYMISSTELTDLDPQHFERIPLNEIDIAQTTRTNRARGIDFEVPQAQRD